LRDVTYDWIASNSRSTPLAAGQVAFGAQNQ